MIRNFESAGDGVLQGDLYRRLFDACPDAVLVADDAGRYLHANPAACALFGVPLEKILGAQIADFVATERVDATRTHFANFRQAGTERGEFVLVRPDGERRTLEYVAVPNVGPGQHASFLRDVSRRKEGEGLALRFRALVENSSDFIGFGSLDGVPVYVNNAGLKMAGLRDLEDAQRRRVIDFHLDADKPFVLGTVLPEVMKLGRWEGEFRFRNFTTGATIPVLYTFFRIDDPTTGQPVGIATVTRDITEAKRQRQALETGASELRLITELMPQMVWSTTPDGTHTYFNKGWTDFTGLSLQQSHGWGWQDVLHPDDLVRTTQVWTHSLETGEAYQIEYRMRSRHGVYRWQLARAQALRDADGKILQWFGTCTDIEDQKRAQEVLERSQAATEGERQRLYRMFMDAPFAMKVVRGDDLVFEFTNRLYQSVFGNRNLKGRSFQQAIPDIAADLLDRQRRVMATGERFEVPEQSAILDYAGDGKPVEKFWHAIYQPLRDPQGKVDALMSFAFEVTDQVRARGRSQELISRLEQERELREQFVSALTHDLRTPLSAARMSAQIIARTPGDSDRAQKNSARVITNVDRADKMIRDLLDANSIRAGEPLPIHPAPCDLQARFRETLDELATAHGDRFELACSQPVEGTWDATSLQRALENLCTNAVKYGSAHSRIGVRLGLSGGEVEIAVHNEGDPIAPEDQQRLFLSFQRSASARSSGSGGWGIGLTLVKGVAQAHGGTVVVESAEGIGTTFTLRIPFVA
jgi:PAS domain S-box-containing protein